MFISLPGERPVENCAHCGRQGARDKFREVVPSHHPARVVLPSQKNAFARVPLVRGAASGPHTHEGIAPAPAPGHDGPVAQNTPPLQPTPPAGRERLRSPVSHRNAANPLAKTPVDPPGISAARSSLAPPPDPELNVTPDFDWNVYIQPEERFAELRSPPPPPAAAQPDPEPEPQAAQPFLLDPEYFADPLAGVTAQRESSVSNDDLERNLFLERPNEEEQAQSDGRLRNIFTAFATVASLSVLGLGIYKHTHGIGDATGASVKSPGRLTLQEMEEMEKHKADLAARVERINKGQISGAPLPKPAGEQEANDPSPKTEQDAKEQQIQLAILSNAVELLVGNFLRAATPEEIMKLVMDAPLHEKEIRAEWKNRFAQLKGAAPAGSPAMIKHPGEDALCGQKIELGNKFFYLFPTRNAQGELKIDWREFKQNIGFVFESFIADEGKTQRELTALLYIRKTHAFGDNLPFGENTVHLTAANGVDEAPSMLLAVDGRSKLGKHFAKDYPWDVIRRRWVKIAWEKGQNGGEPYVLLKNIDSFDQDFFGQTPASSP